MKTLYRSQADRKLGGVCGGIGETYDVDVTVVRLLAIFAVLLTGVVPLTITYLVAWVIVPVKPGQQRPTSRLHRSQRDRKLAGLCGGIGEVLDIDPMIVRLAAVFAAVVTCVLPMVIVYLLAWWIVPVGPNGHEAESREAPPPAPPTT